MHKNAQDAIQSHIKSSRNDKEKNAFAPVEQALPALDIFKKSPQTFFKFTHEVQEKLQNINSSNPGTCFYKEWDEGIVFGVLNGHGDGKINIKKLVDLVSTKFQEKFPEILKQKNGNVIQAFEQSFYDIEDEVEIGGQGTLCGCTAVVSFISNSSSFVYTATLAECEANIYRMMDGKLQSIPLSCIRNWSCKKEADRAKKALPSCNFETFSNPEDMRFPFGTIGVNNSRGLGDLFYNYFIKGTLRKPKITVNQLQPGDRLILCSKSLKDNLFEDEITACCEEAQGNLAQELVQKVSSKNEKVLDDITVFALKVETNKTK